MTRGDDGPPAPAPAPSAPSAPASPARPVKALIHLAVAFHLTAVACWSLTTQDSEAPLNEEIRNRLGPYVYPPGFSQQWNMFAPNPPVSNNRLEAEVTFADGQRATWQVPRMDEMGYFERYRSERYRKWASERVVAAGKPLPLIAEGAARFAAHQVERPGNPARKVELIRYRSQIESPKRGRIRPHDEAPTKWERQLLYACEFDADGRLLWQWPARREATTQPAATRPAELTPPAEVPGDPPEADRETGGGQ